MVAQHAASLIALTTAAARAATAEPVSELGAVPVAEHAGRAQPGVCRALWKAWARTLDASHLGLPPDVGDAPAVAVEEVPGCPFSACLVVWHE